METDVESGGKGIACSKNYGLVEVPTVTSDLLPDEDIGSPYEFSSTGKVIDIRVGYDPDRQLSTFGFLFRLQYRRIMAFSVDVCNNPNNKERSMKIRFACQGCGLGCEADRQHDCETLLKDKESRFEEIVRSASGGVL